MPTHERAPGMTADEAWDLIPWYVNSTLSEQEMQAVELHLSRDPALRAEVAAQTRLAEKVTVLDSLDVELERSLGAMRQRIRAERPDREPPGDGRLAAARRALSGLLRFDLRFLLPLGAAAASVALLLTVLPAPRDGAYTTLTAPAVPADIVQLRIKASDGASEAGLRRLFARHALSVVDGPTEAGVYTLGLAPDADAEAVAAALRAAPEIAFATVRPPR